MSDTLQDVKNYLRAHPTALDAEIAREVVRDARVSTEVISRIVVVAKAGLSLEPVGAAEPEPPVTEPKVVVEMPNPSIGEISKGEPIREIQTPAESTPEISEEPKDEGVTDAEIVRAAMKHFSSGKTDSEVRAALLNEFDGIEQDVDELIKKAHQKVAEILNQPEESAELTELRKFAMEATDKALAAQAEADKQLVEKVQTQGRLNKPVAPEEIQRYAKIIRMQEEKEDKAEDELSRKEFEDEVGEQYPECPIFTGALTDLARACCPSIPLELKQWALITRWGLLRSGLDSLEFEQYLQPRFYTVMVSAPNRGKTAAINESRTLMQDITKTAKAKFTKADNTYPTPCVFSDVENTNSVDSGPFLVQKFFDKAKETSKNYLASGCSDDRAKILLDPDELSDVFQKARTSNQRVSTLFTEFLKLHSSNRTANGTKMTGDRPVSNAHLGIVAGATSRNYPTLWTGTGSGGDGLVSRFLIITTNQGQIPAVPVPTDFVGMKTHSDRLVKLTQLPGQTIRLSQDAGEMLTNWWSTVDTKRQSATRILESIKQLLIVLAVTNLPEDWTGSLVVVGPELVQQAIQFGKYEILVREKLNPGDSWSNIQAMENAIIAWFREHASRSNPKSRNDCRRGIQPGRKPGGVGVFLLAWGNCVTAEILKLREKTQRAGRYSL